MSRDNRKSPTPLSNTSQIPSWVGFAKECQRVLAFYPATDEVADMIGSLEHYRRVFERWLALPVPERPGPVERNAIVLEYMPVHRRAIDMLVRLAKKHPELAKEALRNRSE